MSVTHRLDAVCEISMGQAPDGEAYNDERKGWPLIAGAGDFGEHHPDPKKYTTAASRLSKPGDIVLGIRATIGEKVLSDGEYCLGRGVAGLRVKSDLDARYLWHWLSHVKPELAAKGKGATFKQVNKQDIGELAIDLPHLPEQRRLAAILDQADALRAKRREALAQLDSLTQSIFIEMFGDPIDNPQSHKISKIIELVDPNRPISYGILMPGPDIEGGVKYVRVVDMKNGGIELSGIRRTTPAISNSFKRSLLKSGDLLMSIRGHVGRMAVIPPELEGANITQDSARFAISGANPIYIRECLRTPGFQRWMAKHTKGVAVKGINLGDVKLMPIPLPSQKQQDDFAARAIAIDYLISNYKKALTDSVSLFSSLQHRAFRGEL